MKIITGFGKTTELLREAAYTGWPLVVQDERAATLLRAAAKQQGLVATVLGINQVKSYYLGKKRPEGMLVDDLETVLLVLTGLPPMTVAVGAHHMQTTTRSDTGDHIETTTRWVPHWWRKQQRGEE